MDCLLDKRRIAAAAMLVFGCTAASAASVGTLTCTGQNSVSAQVSKYVVEIQNAGGSTGTGAGAGKVTLNPAEFHVSLSKFSDFLAIVSTGRVFQSCTLAATAPNGVSSTFTFQLAIFTSASAVQESGNGQKAGAYTDVTLQYGSLQVAMSNAVDDGGTTLDTGGSE